jgi:uncharacterized membrane protein YfcA
MTPLSWLLVLTAAFVAAAINSIAGGGTFLSFPTLTGIALLSDKVANMTSTIGLWPGSASSIVAARKDFRRIPRGMVIGYGLISLLGGTAGAVLLRYYTSPERFALVIPWLLAFATIVFAFSKPIARWAGRQHGHRTPGWTLFVGLVQLMVAVYGGYFGAGIGVLMLAGLAFAGLDDVHQMNALKVLLATLINGVASVVFLAGAWNHVQSRVGIDVVVDWRIAGAMAVVSTVGGFLGMAVARRVKQEQLRVVILTIGIALTVVYAVKNYGLVKW